MATRRKPAEHVRTWRLRPLTFLPPSQPRSPFWGPQRTLWLSTRPVRGSASRPAAVRAAGVSARAARSHTPSRRERPHHQRTVCQGTRGKTPGTSKPLIELIFSNITTSPTRGCEEVLHRIAQRPIAIYSGAKVINPNIFLRLLLNFQLAIRNRQTISIRGAE